MFVQINPQGPKMAPPGGGGGGYMYYLGLSRENTKKYSCLKP